jgi:hypothetical protein
MSAFANVVLPEPVAPLTRIFLRAATATLKKAGQSPASRSATNRASTSVRPLALARVVSNSPARASWSIGRVTVEGLRIVKDGQPLGVTDGMTIWQRSPPGRTVEQIGVCPSMSWCVKLAAATASVPSHSLSSSGKSCHRHPAGPRSPPRPGG